jgi:hypothetical protein
LGWFVDATPGESSEFTVEVERDVFTAAPGSNAYGHYNLFTVLAHELGHVLGFDHKDAARFPVLRDELDLGMRYVMAAAAGPASRDGTDTFNVTTTGDGRSRNGDGDLPSGKKKSTDNLNMLYTPPRPTIIHSPATKDPVAGIVDLDYGTARFVVQYD